MILKIIIAAIILVSVIMGGILIGLDSIKKTKAFCESKGFVYLGGNGFGFSYCGEEDERGIIVKKYRINNVGKLEVYNQCKEVHNGI